MEWFWSSITNSGSGITINTTGVFSAEYCIFPDSLVPIPISFKLTYNGIDIPGSLYDTLTRPRFGINAQLIFTVDMPGGVSNTNRRGIY